MVRNGPTKATKEEQKFLLPPRHDKPNEPTKEGPLSFVLFESPFPIHHSFNSQQVPSLSSLSGAAFNPSIAVIPGVSHVTWWSGGRGVDFVLLWDLIFIIASLLVRKTRFICDQGHMWPWERGEGKQAIGKVSNDQDKSYLQFHSQNYPFPNTVCTLGYSDFNNLMGFTSKKLPNNILNNVC
jgi:hypothetical protein